MRGEPKKNSKNGGYDFEGRIALPYKYAMAFGILLFFIGIGFVSIFKNRRESVDDSKSAKQYQGCFADIGDNIVKDTKTGLEWIAGPDKDTTWDEAKAWGGQPENRWWWLEDAHHG